MVPNRLGQIPTAEVGWIIGEPNSSSFYKALGIDHLKTNNSNVGRPIRIVDKSAKVIKDIVA